MRVLFLVFKNGNVSCIFRNLQYLTRACFHVQRNNYGLCASHRQQIIFFSALKFNMWASWVAFGEVNLQFEFWIRKSILKWLPKVSYIYWKLSDFFSDSIVCLLTFNQVVNWSFWHFFKIWKKQKRALYIFKPFVSKRYKINRARHWLTSVTDQKNLKPDVYKIKNLFLKQNSAKIENNRKVPSTFFSHSFPKITNHHSDRNSKPYQD